MYDIIIIGGGPAGMTAAIYTARAGLKTLVLEKESIGGQISTTTLVENYPGFIKISGGELSMNMYDQVLKSGAEFEFDTVTKIVDGKTKKVITQDKEYESKAIIVATGAKYRQLGTDSEKKYIGKGIHFCTSCDAAFYKDKTVAVIGGGNSAVASALTLADLANKVYLIQLLENLTCEYDSVKKIKTKKNIEIICNASVEEFLGNENLEAIKIKVKNDTRIIEVDGVFESIGMIPDTKFIVDFIDIDEAEYIVSDDCYTERKGIFVAGDCRTKEVRQLTTATNDGTIAATLAINYVKKCVDF
ncbi:MAG: FAD-dependent oxidoreductase [Bacilli bacterium]|nr:FAD-dependent oxidoreductase [Bacilli bacterium]MDD3895598.1 FAD-dependent oxidoreductase [Bacilli bacterium]